MSEKKYTYEGTDIEVRYDLNRCIHAAECVHGLPAVFDPKGKPWVKPANASPDEVAEVVVRCPTGALHYHRKDGGSGEVAGANEIDVAADGPLYVRGSAVLRDAEGDVELRDTRVALCRCGLSKRKPLCDGSHSGAFADPGDLGDGGVKDVDSVEGSDLEIQAAKNGPLLVKGDFLLRAGDGTEQRRGNVVALCRCGLSKNKPFCDGSHREGGFEG